ncbi:cell adhesion molecule 4-like [Neoarius graeffei]|uniref:cell adhesion molecule 4-like n=1 Tax=Neoarius graeffei TaxID=443677 RepID=UPI00298C975D|nr:cell adhesion molecule 4-like [Neoarius graeffei]
MMNLSFTTLLSLSVCFLLKADGGPLVLEPSRLVVEYGAKASANCSTDVSHDGMGWEASQGPVDMKKDVQFLTWKVQNLTHWDITPMCYMNLKDGSQVDEELNLVIYKRPDSVSIKLKNCSGPVIEQQFCWLQCNIQNVAPVQYLTVIWYKQQFLAKSNFVDGTKTPVSVSADHIIQPSRNDDGAKYWCEAKLELGPEGPQPPPTKKSDPLSITVHYKPKFSNDTEIIKIKAGDDAVVLNCTATANPPSKYTWTGPYLEKEVKLSEPSLSVSYSGNYTCTASNQYGTAKKLFIFIRESRGHTVFWALLGAGFFIIVLLFIVYLLKKRYTPSRRSDNYNNTAPQAAPREEDEELSQLKLNK